MKVPLWSRRKPESRRCLEFGALLTNLRLPWAGHARPCWVISARPGSPLFPCLTCPSEHRTGYSQLLQPAQGPDGHGELLQVIVVQVPGGRAKPLSEAPSRQARPEHSTPARNERAGAAAQAGRLREPTVSPPETGSLRPSGSTWVPCGSPEARAHCERSLSGMSTQSPSVRPAGGPVLAALGPQLPSAFCTGVQGGLWCPQPRRKSHPRLYSLLSLKLRPARNPGSVKGSPSLLRELGADGRGGG